jgi:hypothetical protein
MSIMIRWIPACMVIEGIAKQDCVDEEYGIHKKGSYYYGGA